MVTGFILVNGSQVYNIQPNTPIQYVAQGVGYFGSMHFLVKDQWGSIILDQYVGERLDDAWLDQVSPFLPGAYRFYPDYDNAPGKYVAFTVGMDAPIPADVGGSPGQATYQGISGAISSVTNPVGDLIGSAKWPLIALAAVAVVGGIIYLKK